MNIGVLMVFRIGILGQLKVGKVRSRETEQKGKRSHGGGQQCGDCRGKRSISGLNGNGKEYNKIKLKIKKIKSHRKLQKMNTFISRDLRVFELCLVQTYYFTFEKMRFADEYSVLDKSLEPRAYDCQSTLTGCLTKIKIQQIK